MDRENLNKYFIVAAFLIIAYLSFTIIQSFLISIFIGGVLAYVVYPIHHRLAKKTGSERSSALILSTAAVILVVALLAGAFIFIVPPVISDLGSFSRMYDRTLTDFLEERAKCSAGSVDVKCQFFTYLTNEIDLGALQDTTIAMAKGYVVEFVKNLPNIFLQLTVITFSTFYFLANGHSIIKKTLHGMPLKPAQKSYVVRRVDDVLAAVIYGNLFTAFIEGVIGTLIFFVLGIDLALMAGVLIMFFALIPPLGAMIVWGPAVVVLVLLKEYTKAALLLGACLVFMGFIDNFGRPMIISRRVKLSAFWVLLGVLGGLLAFGFIGIIVGPLVLALFVTFLRLAVEELSEDSNGHA